jgi:hypothetical protein
MGSVACDLPPDGSPSCQYKSSTSQELHQLWHQENPSTTISGHKEVNPRASSSSSARMASSSEPSRKWGREEEDDNESRRCRLVKEGTMLAPEVPEEVPPLPPDEPEEVPPPPPPSDEPEEALAP